MLTSSSEMQDQDERHHKKQRRIFHVDEAGLHDGIHVEKAYSPKNTTPFVKTCDSKKKDTIVVAVANDGTKLPIYVHASHLHSCNNCALQWVDFRRKKTRICKETGKQIVVDRGCSGVGVLEWWKYVEFFLKQPEVESGDVVCYDRLKAHSNPEAEKKIAEKGKTENGKSMLT